MYVLSALNNCAGTQLASKQLTLKGAFSDLKQFLAIESPLKMMKNAFYLTLSSFRSQNI